MFTNRASPKCKFAGAKRTGQRAVARQDKSLTGAAQARREPLDHLLLGCIVKAFRGLIQQQP